METPPIQEKVTVISGGIREKKKEFEKVMFLSSRSNFSFGFNWVTILELVNEVCLMLKKKFFSLFYLEIMYNLEGFGMLCGLFNNQCKKSIAVVHNYGKQ